MPNVREARFVEPDDALIDPARAERLARLEAEYEESPTRWNAFRVWLVRVEFSTLRWLVSQTAHWLARPKRSGD